MHELSLCADLIAQVESIARKHRAQQVDRITVRIGPLSGVEPQLLKSAFSIANQGTLAENAALILEKQPIRVACQVCGVESVASANNLLCRACGGNQTKLLTGDELILARVELLSSE